MQHARSLLCYERLLSIRVSNLVRVSLERAPVGGRHFRHSVAVVGVVFGPLLDVWNSLLSNSFARLSVCDCRVDSRLVTIARLLTQLVLFLCGSPSWWYCQFQGCAEVLTQMSDEFRVAHCWLREGICLLVHIEFCVKTLHLGTVSVCLARRLCRDVAVVLIASVVIWISDIVPNLF